MSSKISLILFLVFICSISFASDNCLYAPPAPCESLPDNPCSDYYWQQMRSNQCYPFVSPGNPMQVFGNQEPIIPYDIPASERLFKSGPLLFHGRSAGTQQGMEELVFLKGAGEYYEINALPDIPDDRIDDLFIMLYRNKINLVRLFTFSGDVDRVQDGWVYPFTWHPETQQFALREYSTAFFQRLEKFLDAAENAYSHDYVSQPGAAPVTVHKQHKIFINLCLFDFSDDMGFLWDSSAWNCNNNDHGTHTSFDWKEMYHIFESDGSLNSLGRVQRDFVLKIVRSTRHHSNVYYEIQNTPRLYEPEAVARWTDQVNQWIKHGLVDCDCDGAANHLTALTQSTLDEVTMTLMALPEIDIFGRHDACKGMIDREQYMDADTPCHERATMHLSLETQSEQFHTDFYAPFITGTPLTILADTDGLHRVIGGHKLAPYGRDFDFNCRYWAHIAFVHGGLFNTKETLHYYENPYEVDCIMVEPDDAQYCYYKYGERMMQPLSCANCDDFIWEHEDYGYGNRFCGFDTGVAAAINDLPLTRRPFVRMAGFGPVPVQPGENMTLYVVNGNVYGNETGSAIATHLAYVMPPATGYVPAPPYQEMVYVDTLPTRNDNSREYSLPVTAEWQSFCPMLLALVNTTPSGAVSDPWPYLISHADTVVPETRAKQSSASRPSKIDGVINSNQGHRSSALPISPTLRQRWGQALVEHQACATGNNTASADSQPRICMAGWNYSTLMDSFSTGLLQIAVVVFMPGESSGGGTVTSAPDLSIRLVDPLGSSQWVGLGPIDNWSVTAETGGVYYSTSLLYDIHGEDPAGWLDAGAYLLEIKADMAGVESNVWPYFDF